MSLVLALLLPGCPGGGGRSPARTPGRAPVKAIIFDIGNVFVHVDPALGRRALQQAGMPVTEEFLAGDSFRALSHQYHVGSISTDQFNQGLAHLLGTQPLPSATFAQAWNAILPSLLEESVQTLPAFRAKGYPLFALSDNNPLHAQRIQDLYRLSHPGKDFFALFDKSYLSQVTGHHKTSDEAWTMILAEQNLKAEECLFVDDHGPNIIRAGALGFQVFHFTPGTRMETVLASLDGP